MPLKGEFTLPKNTQQASAHEKKPVGMLSTFFEYPEGVSFLNQGENEEIILLLRRDFITNVPWILTAIGLAIVPPITAVLSSLFFPFFTLSGQTLFAILTFYYTVVFGFILLEFSLWYFHVGLVTDARVVDIDVINILARDVSEVYLNDVKDVSYAQKGALATFFNFGGIFVQTNVTLQNVEFDSVPRPTEVARIISDLVGTKPRE